MAGNRDSEARAFAENAWKWIQIRGKGGEKEREIFG